MAKSALIVGASRSLLQIVLPVEGRLPPRYALRGLPFRWIATATAVLLGSCQADHLVDPSTDPDAAPGRSVALSASPSRIVDTMDVGTSEARVHRITVAADDAEGVEWLGRSRQDSDWLDIDPERGTAPQEVSARLEGKNLSVGRYVDTLRFETGSGSEGAASVPVILVVRSSDGGAKGGRGGGRGGDDDDDDDDDDEDDDDDDDDDRDDRIPDPPSVPEDRAQLERDGRTPIPVGKKADGTTVVFQARVADPDPDASIRIEVELARVGIPFLGLRTWESRSVSDGDVASIRVEGLFPQTAYHWRVRAVDETGRESAWASFGNNGELDVDFQTSKRR